MDTVSSTIPLPSALQDFNFMFKPDAQIEFIKSKFDTRNKAAERLEHLIKDPTVGGFPFIEFLFKNAPCVEAEELTVLAAALQRIAELLEPFKKLDEEVRNLAFIQTHPHFIARAFGDFQAPDTDFFITSSEASDPA